jgi:hypothetical protein
MNRSVVNDSELNHLALSVSVTKLSRLGQNSLSLNASEFNDLSPLH